MISYKKGRFTSLTPILTVNAKKFCVILKTCVADTLIFNRALRFVSYILSTGHSQKAQVLFEEYSRLVNLN